MILIVIGEGYLSYFVWFFMPQAYIFFVKCKYKWMTFKEATAISFQENIMYLWIFMGMLINFKRYRKVSRLNTVFLFHNLNAICF